MLGVSTSQETYQSGADADSIVTGISARYSLAYGFSWTPTYISGKEIYSGVD
jgi:hypothetical protein